MARCMIWTSDMCSYYIGSSTQSTPVLLMGMDVIRRVYMFV